jgi:hypothetical protein
LREDEVDELMVAIEAEGELHVLVLDPVEPLEEMRIVSHARVLVREYRGAVATGQAFETQARARPSYCSGRRIP